MSSMKWTPIESAPPDVMVIGGGWVMDDCGNLLWKQFGCVAARSRYSSGMWGGKFIRIPDHPYFVTHYKPMPPAPEDEQ